MTISKIWSYPHPHPAIAVDVVVLAIDEGELGTLLIQRGEPPFKGEWALPGGFLRPDETVEAAARRELAEETGFRAPEPIFFGVFSDPARDPRERVVSIAFFALAPYDAEPPVAGTDAAAAAWHLTTSLPPLAFDHAAILETALTAARRAAREAPLAAQLICTPFTLAEFQTAQETLLGETLDKRNFQRTVLERGWLTITGEMRRGAHRPAQLFRVNTDSRSDRVG